MITCEWCITSSQRARAPSERRAPRSRAAAGLLPVLEHCRGVTGLGLFEGRRVDDPDRFPLGVQRERAAQRCSPLLAVHLERVRTRLRAERDAPAGPDRRAVRACASTTGTLLAPRLGAAAGDHPAR